MRTKTNISKSLEGIDVGGYGPGETNAKTASRPRGRPRKVASDAERANGVAPIEDATLTPIFSTALERELDAIAAIARILHGLDSPDEVRDVLAFVARHYPA